MANIPANQSIAFMTISGTHDSCAVHGGWIWQMSKRVTPRTTQQGCTFLAVRCHVINNNSFDIHHQFINQKITFGQVFNDSLEFLTNHPTETILMRIKQEFSKDSNSGFIKIFDNYRQDTGPDGKLFGDKMFVEDRILNLGEVRGKIVILSDVIGLQGIRWDQLDIQDHFGLLTAFEIPGKWEKVKAHLDKAAYEHHAGNSTLFVNYASAAIGVLPWTVADYVNKQLYTYLVTKVYDFMPPKGNEQSYFGIVAMDFPEYYDKGVVEKLIRRNNFNI
jgi:1-phosphatidylinositol phosphodiesterase